MKIPYRLLAVTLSLQSGIPVSSFLAATIRGGFGYILRRIVCVQHSIECRRCMLKDNCGYPFLFETPPPPGASRLGKYENIPRPFALRPHQNGSCLTLDLLLLGKAVEMAPLFIFTLNELGKKGLGAGQIPFIVNEVRLEDATAIYTADHPDKCVAVTPHALEITPGTPAQGAVTVTFVSPLVIRKNGLPDIPRGSIVVLEGRAPVWRYAIAQHRLHGSPAAAIAVYDPRIGAVIVQSHSPMYHEGDVVDVTV